MIFTAYSPAGVFILQQYMINYRDMIFIFNYLLLLCRFNKVVPRKRSYAFSPVCI